MNLPNDKISGDCHGKERMKINIGSNTVRHDGFKNLDIRPAEGVDIIDDAGSMDSIAAGSCEAIVAHSILEHFAYDEVQIICDLWTSKLCPGGWIEIGVPDMYLIMLRYLFCIPNNRHENIWPWQRWTQMNHSIFGNMDLLREWHGDDANKYGHHVLFTPGHLRSVMRRSGLHRIRRMHRNHRDNVTLRGLKPSTNLVS